MARSVGILMLALAEVAHASEDGWNDVQYKAESAWDDLEQAFRDASGE